MSKVRGKTKYRIAVDVDGSLVVVTDGLISTGERSLRERIEFAGLSHEAVQIVSPYGDYIVASIDDEDPLGNFAAVVSVSPRFRILEAPPVIYEFLEEQSGFASEENPTLTEKELELNLGALDV